MNYKKIVLKLGESYISFGFSRPFWLGDVSGLHAVEYENQTEDNYGLPGTTIKSSRQRERTIEMQFSILSDYTNNRNKLYSLLPCGKTGTMYFYDEKGSVKVIDYVVESIDIPAIGKKRDSSIVLMCPYPYFRDLSPTFYNMADWVGGMEFDIDCSDEMEFETRVSEQLKTVSNFSGVETPIKVTFTANGEVVNPSIQNVNTGETMSIDDTLAVGDVITIDTQKGVKQKIIKNGSPANNLWHFGSSWLQLPIGDSTLKYNADSGIDNLGVEIEVTTLYRGA